MNRINNNYAVVDFQNDMAVFSQADIEAYEAGRCYAFPGSYKSDSVLLRENSLKNVLSHDVEGKLSDKEKILLSLCVIFSDQEFFDDLYYAGLSVDQIANTFKTTSSNVTMKIMYDAAKQNFLENKKTKSY